MTENNILIYELKDGSVKVDVNAQNEDVWLRQELMVRIRNIRFSEGVLDI